MPGSSRRINSVMQESKFQMNCTGQFFSIPGVEYLLDARECVDVSRSVLYYMYTFNVCRQTLTLLVL